MQLSIIGEGDLGDVVEFIANGTATAWSRESWLGSCNSGVVARDQGQVCGVLPIRPLRRRFGTSIKTANYCSAVRVAPEMRNRGIGRRMMDFAGENYVSPSSFLVVVRDDPQSSAYRWYAANGFESVAKVVSYRVRRVHESPATTPTSLLRVLELNRLTSEQSNSYQSSLSAAARSPHAFWERKSLDDWRLRMKFHYYSSAYSDQRIFQVAVHDFVLLGLCAYTEMRDEPRVDILDFVYRGDNPARNFAIAAELAVESVTSDRAATVFWNMNVLEAMQLGIAERWEARWQTEVLTRGLASEDRRNIDSSFWVYRQLDFV